MIEPAPSSPRGAAAGPPAPRRRPSGPDLLGLLATLGRRRRWLVLGPAVAALVAAAISLVLPLRYTAVTRILPPQQAQSSAAAMLGQLGGLAGAAGGALGLKNPSDLYVGMLRSTTVADALIGRFGLRARYGVQYQMEAREVLDGRTKVQAEKSGIITIAVTAEEPGLAAEMANAYVEQLHQLTSTLAVTEAAHRRVFFERQLQQARDKLAEVEAKLRSAMASGGLVSVDAQSRVAVETVARLRAELSVKEIQLGAMRGYATAGNPDLRRAEQELASMRKELTRLESGLGDAVAPGSGDATAPATGVANIRLVREVKYQEVLYELLARQYELARVDESKEAPVVQVLDPAAPPEKRSSPRRALIVLGTGVLALLLTIVAILLLGALEEARRDPLQRERLTDLGAAWRRGGPTGSA